MAGGRDVRTGIQVLMRYRVFDVIHVEHGHWCNRCMLPSAVLVWIVSQVSIGGVEQPMRLSQGLRCQDCGTWGRPDVDH